MIIHTNREIRRIRKALHLPRLADLCYVYGWVKISGTTYQAKVLDTLPTT